MKRVVNIKETSTNQENREKLSHHCGVNEVLSFMGKRWMMAILYEISLGNDQFSVLKKSLPGLSDHILAVRIEDMASTGLIIKNELNNRRPVEIVYELSEKGKQLLELVDSICKWNKEWKFMVPEHAI